MSREYRRTSFDERDSYSEPRGNERGDRTEGYSQRSFGRGQGRRGRGGRARHPVQIDTAPTAPKGLDMNDVRPKALSKSSTPPRDEPLWEDSVFGEQMSATETRGRTYFYGDYSTLLEYSDDIYDVMSSGQQDIEKKFSKEMFRYYCTALLWARILDIRSQEGQVLTQTERDYKDTIQTLNLTVPHPIQQYLTGVGQVRRMGGNILYPDFPTLPAANIGGRGGFFGTGVITPGTLPNYIGFPTLGTISDSLRAQATQPFTGVYASSVGPPAPATATNNLPGFGQASKPRPEAAAVLHSAGITAVAFPESVPNTGLNINVLAKLAHTLTTITVYKVAPVSFFGASINVKGTPAQLIIQRRYDPQAGKFLDGVFTGHASERYFTPRYNSYVLCVLNSNTLCKGYGLYFYFASVGFGIW